MTIYPRALRVVIPFTLLLFLFIINSCSKQPQVDDADAFVGLYKASVVHNAHWGASNGTLSLNGKFYVGKVSANRVLVTGYINTYGAVVGNTVYFEGYTTTDDAGSISITFQPAVLNGDVLIFNTNSSGQLKDNGVSYPYNSSASWTCVKQP